jgi:hypothetical protein
VDDLMRGGVRLAAAVLLGVLAVAPTAHGQVLPQLLPPAPATPPAAAPAPAAQPVPEAHDSPRA